MAFTRIDGRLLHWRDSGPHGAPAVVLVNSLGTDFRIWDEIAAALSREWRVIVHDKRGHGLSDVPQGPYAIADFTHDLIGLADHVGLGRFAVVGLSIGGLIGQDLALKAPERLTALVLADTAPKVGSAESWNARIEAVRAGGLAAIADPVMERWFTPAFHAQRPDDLAGWRNALLRQPADGYIATCQALSQADLTASIGAIAVPTLAVVGDGDLSTPPELVRAMAERIPGAGFALIEGCGHIPPVEQPARLLAVMTEYLEKHGRG